MAGARSIRAMPSITRVPRLLIEPPISSQMNVIEEPTEEQAPVQLHRQRVQKNFPEEVKNDSWVVDYNKVDKDLFRYPHFEFTTNKFGQVDTVLAR
jgi:hypothetical protein